MFIVENRILARIIFCNEITCFPADNTVHEVKLISKYCTIFQELNSVTNSVIVLTIERIKNIATQELKNPITNIVRTLID